MIECTKKSSNRFVAIKLSLSLHIKQTNKQNKQWRQKKTENSYQNAVNSVSLCADSISCEMYKITNGVIRI